MPKDRNRPSREKRKPKQQKPKHQQATQTVEQVLHTEHHRQERQPAPEPVREG